jgi:hypothetical protein
LALIALKSEVSSSLAGLAMTEASCSGALAQVHEQRRVAAVVEDHVRPLAAELEDLVRVLPVLVSDSPL